jgi:hypothetical protein
MLLPEALALFGVPGVSILALSYLAVPRWVEGRLPLIWSWTLALLIPFALTNAVLLATISNRSLGKSCCDRRVRPIGSGSAHSALVDLACGYGDAQGADLAQFALPMYLIFPFIAMRTNTITASWILHFLLPQMALAYLVPGIIG